MRADELRDAFDATFARPVADEAAATERLLLVRVGGEPHALRLSEIAGLYTDRVLTAVPSRARTLLGITGVRGAVVPVFDLGAHLGYAAATAKPRWLVIAARQRVGFAFDAFEGHLAVSAGGGGIVHAREGLTHVRDVARAGDELRPIVLLESVIAALERKEA